MQRTSRLLYYVLGLRELVSTPEYVDCCMYKIKPRAKHGPAI